MRKLVLFIATSLDGYIARLDGGIDWLFSDQDYGYAEFFAGVDTVVMGRKTYDVSLTFGEYPYKDKRGFVFSRTLYGQNENVSFVEENIAEFIPELKQSLGKNIWLVGGSEIVAECVRQDLIDNFIISVHPMILGKGIPLFLPDLPERKIELLGSKHFDSGLVQLSYKRVR